MNKNPAGSCLIIAALDLLSIYFIIFVFCHMTEIGNFITGR